MGGMRLFRRCEGRSRLVHPLWRHDLCRSAAQSEVKLDDGRVWRNMVTPEKSKVAETLDEFRGNHRYNLLDEHVRRFNASVSQFVLWDDHEVLNNWYPTEVINGESPYAEQSVALLAARASARSWNTRRSGGTRSTERIYRASRFGPLVEVFGFDMRSYRGANREPSADVSEESAILGGAGRVAEAAAADVDGDVEDHRQRHAARPRRARRMLFEAVSNGDTGRRSGARWRSRRS